MAAPPPPAGGPGAAPLPGAAAPVAPAPAAAGPAAAVPPAAPAAVLVDGAPPAAPAAVPVGGAPAPAAPAPPMNPFQAMQQLVQQQQQQQQQFQAFGGYNPYGAPQYGHSAFLPGSFGNPPHGQGFMPYGQPPYNPYANANPFAPRQGFHPFGGYGAAPFGGAPPFGAAGFGGAGGAVMAPMGPLGGGAPLPPAPLAGPGGPASAAPAAAAPAAAAVPAAAAPAAAAPVVGPVGTGGVAVPAQEATWVLTASGIPRRYEDILRELDTSKTHDAPVCGSKADGDVEQWLTAIEAFISSRDECGDCLTREAQLIMMPRDLVQAQAIAANNVDIACFDPNDTTDMRRAKVLEKKRYDFVYQCLLHGLSKRPDLGAVLQQVPKPNAFIAWQVLQASLRGFNGSRREEYFTKWEMLTHKSGVSIAAFNSEFNTLVQQIAATGVALDQHQVCRKYVRTVNVPTTVRMMLEANMSHGILAIQAQAMNHMSHHPPSRGPQVHVVDASGRRGYSPDGEREPRSARRSKKRDDTEKPLRTAKGKGQSGPFGRPNGNGKFCTYCGFYNHDKSECRKKRDKEPRAWKGPAPSDLDVEPPKKSKGEKVKKADGNKAKSKTPRSASAAEREEDSDVDSDDSEPTVEGSSSDSQGLSVTVRKGPAALASTRRSRPSRRAAQRASSPTEPKLLLDSGASHHMVTSEIQLDDVRVSDHGLLTAARKPLGGETKIGTLTITTNDGGTLKLEKVYTNDRLRTNLLSVNRLIEVNKLDVKFDNDGGRVATKDGKVLLDAPAKGHLYQIDLRKALEVKRAINALTTSIKQTQLEWHIRLGHASYKAMKRLKESGTIPELKNIHLSKKTEPCEVCLQSKATLKPFAKSLPERTKATRAFERVHADLMGPIATPSMNDDSYVLVIVDEFTNFVWVEALETKDQAAPTIDKWARTIHTRFGIWPSEFRTDVGGEFRSKELLQTWVDNGVRPTTSPPYTPQLNSRVERMNRTVGTIARSLILQSGAPTQLWHMAIQHAALIHNTSHLREGDDKTPHHSLYGAPASLSILHPWGCTAMMTLQGKEAEAVGKFGAKAIKVAWIGTTTNGDASILIEPKHADVYHSRHVKWLDSDFGAMKKLKETILKVEPDTQELDEEFFARHAEDNENRLALDMIEELQRLEPSGQPPARARTPSPKRSSRSKKKTSVSSQRRAESIPAPAAKSEGRYPSRRRAPPHRLGMVDYERELIAGAVKLSALTARRQRVSPQELAEAREAAKKNYFGVIPIDESVERKYDQHGAIKMPSQRCIADKAHGGQCGLRTCNGAYCWIHLQRESGLRAKPSQIPGAGRGLFTTRVFQPNEEITRYTGDLAATPASRHLVKKSQYIAMVTNERWVDAARTNSMPGRLINSPAGTRLRTNASWHRQRGTNTIIIRAAERIPAGTEILIGYGAGYWRDTRSRKKAEGHSAKVEFGPEPKTMKEAQNSPEWEAWKKAAAEEQQSLRDYKVYVIVERSKLPTGAHVLTAKWVFKRKLDGDGNVVRHKARVVGRGYTQLAGVHYDETMADVMQLRSARLLVALANQLDYNMNIMDVHTAYLNAPLDKEIYMKAPDGFVGPESGKILKLQKALYGLKQSGRLWNETLTNALKKLGYRPLDYIDPCVMTRKSKTGRPIIIGTYVDDMPHLWHPDDDAEMKADKSALCKQFEIVDLGPATDFLGIKIVRDRKAGTVRMHQTGYATSICNDYGFDPETVRHESTPEFSSKGDPASSDKTQLGKINAENFRAFVGSVGFLVQATRPDLAHALNMLARAQANVQPADILRAKRLLRYLASTVSLGITYHRTKTFEQPEMYVDSDWAGDDADAKSTTGFVSMFGGGALTWATQKQKTVSMSTAEAEYVAAATAGQEICWLRSILHGLGFGSKEPTTLHIDNATSIIMATDESSSVRRRHINVKHHKIREWIAEKSIKAEKVDTRFNLADLFTKNLGRQRFVPLREVILGNANIASIDL